MFEVVLVLLLLLSEVADGGVHEPAGMSERGGVLLGGGGVGGVVLVECAGGVVPGSGELPAGGSGAEGVGDPAWGT